MQPLILVLLAVTLVAQQQRAAPEIHLIPDGYVARIWSASVPDTLENRGSSAVEVFNLRRGRLQAGRLPCDVEYQQYFIGTRAQLLVDDGMTALRRLQSYLQANFRCR